MYDTPCSQSRSTTAATARKRRLITAGFGMAIALTIAAPAFALEPGHDVYDGGTATTVPQGSPGSLDTSSPTTLIFKASSGEINIPYQSIQSMQYSTELARHLGAVPAAAAGLVRHRERKHYLTINYQDAAGTAQTPAGNLDLTSSASNVEPQPPSHKDPPAASIRLRPPRLSSRHPAARSTFPTTPSKACSTPPNWHGISELCRPPLRASSGTGSASTI